MSDAHDHDHDAKHPPHLAHHFDSMTQQFESGKLGMWLFLATELLMFGGLFCAYSIYRARNPDVYMYAHQALDTSLGAINTVVLLLSSFTMAWAVRAAQLGKRNLLLAMLVLTFLGGCGFMVIKSIEYSGKYAHGLWVGPQNAFYYDTDFLYGETAEGEGGSKLIEAQRYIASHGSHGGADHGDAAHPTLDHDPHTVDDHAAPQADPAALEALAADQDPAPEATVADRSTIRVAPVGPVATASLAVEDPFAVGKPLHVYPTFQELSPLDQKRTHLFFQIYYMMTGLHGIHVLIGMGVIAYLIVKAVPGTFGPNYFTPIEIGGLYWHLVDLIWIFLFPLLYLIR